MRIRTEIYAALAAVALSALTLLGVRAGCDLGVMRHATNRIVATTQLPAWVNRLPALSQSTSTVDRAGAGLDTGMPYYSFAQRSMRL